MIQRASWIANASMEKINCAAAANRKSDPSFLLYKFDSELINRENNSLRYVVNEACIGWETPEIQLKVTTMKKKKNKRGPDSRGEKKLAAPYHDGIWTGSVEKYSYRYVPNNGCYRAMKTQMAQSKYNVVQRKHSPTTGVILSSQQKTLRREISKDLRKQFQSLLERNHAHFSFQQSSSAVTDYLEDEEDYKTNHGDAKKPTPCVFVPSSTEQLFGNREVLPTRTLETQSAHPTPIAGRLEDLVISKRCSTNLDKITQIEPSEAQLSPPDKSWIKADKPHSKSVPLIQTPFNRMQVTSTNEVDALAKQTFTNRRGPMEAPLRASRSLGPIEKVTPSLREVYDNSKAVQEMVKFSHFTSAQPVDINVSSYSSTKRKAESNLLDLTSKPKVIAPTKSKVAVGPGVTSNFRTAKGDVMHKTSKVSQVINVDVDNPNSTFQAFLPSISGKRITTKVSSLR